MNSQLVIYSSGAFALTQTKLIFDDWFDFADYVKQENLRGKSVTITHWEYLTKTETKC